jgi:hypothetical protein
MADTIDITVNETVETVEIIAQPNVITVNITRTSGSGSNLQLGETDTTAYRGDRGKIAYDHSQIIGNPHGTTKNDLGLGDVPNLDTTNAVNDSHTHGNKSTLDLITEAFTTTLKTAYDSAVTWISTNETNLISHLSNTSNPHSTTASQVGAYTSGQVDTLLTSKQSALNFDSTPTNASTNPVTSGGVFTALGNKQDTLTETNFGTFTNTLTTQDAIDDADVFNYRDTSDSGKQKKTLWSNIKAVLKTYFDAFYSQKGGTFSIRLQGSALASPADSTTYYVSGSNNLAPSTTNNRFVYAGITASKFKVSLFVYNNGTLGTGQTVTFKLLNVTQSTEVTITTTALFNSVSYGSVTEHLFSITQGDSLALQFDTPVFATNPTQIVIGCNLMLIQ